MVSVSAACKQNTNKKKLLCSLLNHLWSVLHSLVLLSEDQRDSTK